MDLLELQSGAEPVWFTLTHPSTGMDLENGGKPIRILINGPDSPSMVTHERKVTDRRLSRAGRTGKINLTAAELEAESIEGALAALAGWDNLEIGGDAPAYSAAKAKEILSNPGLRWLVAWINEKVSDRGNFLGASASTAKK